jgi:hypothetical protein
VPIELLPTRKRVGSAEKNLVFVTLSFFTKMFTFDSIYRKFLVYSLPQIR